MTEFHCMEIENYSTNNIVYTGYRDSGAKTMRQSSVPHLSCLATRGGPSTSAHGLSLNIARPLEEIALILMVHFLPPPLVPSLIVPRADRTRTKIKRLSLVRPWFVHSPLLCRLAVDSAEWRGYWREECGPGRPRPRRGGTRPRRRAIFVLRALTTRRGCI
jgi:hypothetical protein